MTRTMATIPPAVIACIVLSMVPGGYAGVSSRVEQVRESLERSHLSLLRKKKAGVPHHPCSATRSGHDPSPSAVHAQLGTIATWAA